jgi:hypothetical protein
VLLSSNLKCDADGMPLWKNRNVMLFDIKEFTKLFTLALTLLNRWPKRIMTWWPEEEDAKLSGKGKWKE